MREGSLEAPVRHALDWRSPWFWDEAALEREMERVFDICHGCRRCFNLCDSFPRLFDLIDNSPTGELDGVEKEDYGSVEQACTLCDMCFMTKCPYVPPHASSQKPTAWVGSAASRPGLPTGQRTRPTR
jgi:glycerol-3-phosphate dehydrogenase subunit C